MPEIFFPSQNISSQQIFGKDAPLINILAQNNAFSCNELTANMPYCLAEMSSPESKIITQTLGNIPEASRQNLMCTIDTFGDFTATLAAFYDNNLKFIDLQTAGSLLGAGATASEVRLNGFQKALIAYQEALVALNNHKGVGRGPSAARIEKKNKVRLAYGELQKKYQTELKKIASPNSLGKNRGNALAGSERGITLAQRRGRGINVASNTQALQIARMAKGVSYAGKGLLVLDAGMRTQMVRNTYRQGGNWQREAAVQATGFGVGGATGMAIGKAVVLGLTTIGLGMTPVGWVVLISAGVAAGFGAAYVMDSVGKDVAAAIWDM